MSIPILTVTITILVTVFVALMARQLKISEFRQAWIDGIRKDVSEYMSKAHEWIDLYIVFNNESDQNVKAKIALELDRIKYDSFHVLWRIELRFKPDDNEANKLLLCLRNLLDPGKLTPENRYSSWRDMSDNAVLNTRILLKEEWEATKSPFRRTRKNKESNNA